MVCNNSITKIIVFETNLIDYLLKVFYHHQGLISVQNLSYLTKRVLSPMKAILAVMSILSLSAFASDTPAAPATVSKDAAVHAVIKQNLTKLGLKAGDISRSPDKNLFQVITERGLFYFSDNGKMLIHGKMYDVSGQGVENVTEGALAQVRIDGMKKFEDSMIVFPAKNEKYQVTVFTDTTCGYCRKLHSQMPEYNELGITVRYMAFPRSGAQGSTYNQLKAIWCAEDQQKAMTDAKAGERLDTSKVQMCNAPIADQYAMGMKVGVSGTPAIMFENGTMIPGYQDPAQLLQSLIASE